MRKYVLTAIVLMELVANKGKGMPILFEGGSQADVSVWDTILKPVADVTRATLITYERPGDGSSELDTSNHDPDRHGILQVRYALCIPESGNCESGGIVRLQPGLFFYGCLC